VQIIFRLVPVADICIQAASFSLAEFSCSLTAPCLPWVMYVHPICTSSAVPLNKNNYQILFLIGLTIIIGPQKTAAFFARRQKIKGTAAFFSGLTLILLRWPLIGFCVELYGILILFGDFLGTIASFARNVPVIGPYIGQAVDRSGMGVRRNADLPV